MSENEAFYKWALDIIKWYNTKRNNLDLTNLLAVKLKSDVETFVLEWYCDDCDPYDMGFCDNCDRPSGPRYNEGYM